MGSAQCEFVDEDEVGGATALEEFRLEPRGELKEQVAARLAAHRRRRGFGAGAVEPTSQGRDVGHPHPRRQNAVAAAVAERYARTPSYRAVLAEQARRAVEEAEARAEVSRRNAAAVAAARQELLGELELWDAPQEFTLETAEVLEAVQPTSQKRDVGDSHPEASGGGDVGHAEVMAGLRVRLYEDLGVRGASSEATAKGASAPSLDTAESLALDEEIAFRKAPVFEDYKAFLALDREPPVPLPANLLEFPRQLIATRKARPRLAEGPLRDETAQGKQLRIFEVEAAQISTAPAAAAVAAEWTASIRLDAHCAAAPVASEGAPLMAPLLPPQTAPMALRAMAALVDGGLVLAGLVAFVAVFAKVAGQVPGGVQAAIGLAGTAFALAMLYQVLFFSLSEQTPGMRYAKIGLCTFSDENPTRSAMRKRIVAQIVAACPMGVGLLWSLLDDDGLGWHDRISRMYQRAY